MCANGCSPSCFSWSAQSAMPPARCVHQHKASAPTARLWFGCPACMACPLLLTLPPSAFTCLLSSPPPQVYMTAAELMEAELKRRGGESTCHCCGAVVSFHTAAACWGLGADELPWLSPCLRFSCNLQDRSPPVATVLVTLHPTCRGRAQREQAHGGAAGGNSGGGNSFAAVERRG